MLRLSHVKLVLILLWPSFSPPVVWSGRGAMASSPGELRVVVSNGLTDYIFWYSGRLLVRDLKLSISRVISVPPRQLLLYHRDLRLADETIDIRRFDVSLHADLRLRVVVTIFGPM